MMFHGFAHLSAMKVALALAVATVPASAASAAPGYADIADLTLAAPVIVKASITRSENIAARDSPGLAAGQARLLITAAVDGALVAGAPVPATLTWLWDAPLDARGKPPRPKGMVVLAWLSPPDAAGKTRLVTPQAQQAWDSALEARVRAIAVEARSGQVPMVSGVTNGFRADGTVKGESEAQFFLAATDNHPLALIVTTRPGEPKRVTVARGDVIDDSAESVKPETLLWYRLACFLPASLPAAAGGNDKALAADWRAALATLGPCGRVR